MSEVAYRVCDNCGEKFQTKPARYGGYGMVGWVKIIASVGCESEFDLCSMQCASEWIAAQTPTPTAEEKGGRGW